MSDGNATPKTPLTAADTAPLDAYGAIAKKSVYFHPREWCSAHPLAEPYPIAWLEDRWLPLARVLDAIRGRIGAPITITPNGGYRCPEHNRAVGGQSRSQHLEGRAADFVVRHALWLPAKVHELVLDLWKTDQLPGLSGLGSYPKFIHVDVGEPASLAVGHLRRWSGSRDQLA